MIIATTPGGHHILTMVFVEPQEGITHVVECLHCGRQCCVHSDEPSSAIAAMMTVHPINVHPSGIREYVTELLMYDALGHEPHIDGELDESIQAMLDFFDEQACDHTNQPVNDEQPMATV